MPAHAVLVALALILAPLGAGRRPRGVVAEGLLRPRGRGARGTVPPSSRKPANRSRLPSLKKMSFRSRSRRRSRPASHPTSPTALTWPGMSEDGPSTTNWSICPTLWAAFPISSIRTPSTSWCCSTRRPDKKALYGLPIGRSTVHIHVWKSLPTQAGLTLAAIPASGRRSGDSGATRCSRPSAERRAARTSGASALPMSLDAARNLDVFSAVHDRLRRGLRDPRWPSRHR